MLSATNLTKTARRAQTDPVWFIEEVLGDRLWTKQREIAEAVRDHKRVSVASCHGAGKSFLAARLAVWFVCAFPGAIVATTAPTFRQVQKVLWNEIRRAVKRSQVQLGGELLQTEYRLGDGWYAFGFSTDDPDRFQGLHSPHVLVIFDEAAGIAAPIYEAAEGVLTSHHCRQLLIGNPTNPSGPFYESFRKPGYAKIHISAFDIPNVTEGREVFPGLTTAAWVEDKASLWGMESPAYKARVLGEFPDTSSDTVIPLSWVEVAQARWMESYSDGRRPGSLTAIGVDVGAGGDKTVLAPRHGKRLEELRRSGDPDVMAAAGLVHTSMTTETVAIVDATGIGAGVYRRLKELGRKAEAFVAAEKTVFRDRSGVLEFANKRAAAWWSLREMLDPANGDKIELPPDDLLTGDLTSPRWRIQSGGKILIESKDDIRKRLGRSPDDGDAVVMAFWEEPKRKKVLAAPAGVTKVSAWKM